MSTSKKAPHALAHRLTLIFSLITLGAGLLNPAFKEIWFATLQATGSTRSLPVILFATFATMHIVLFYPVVLALIWVPASESLRRWSGHYYAKALLIFAGFLYALLSHRWAQVEINRIFAVDPSHFGFATTLLAALYGPFGLFYEPLVEHQKAIRTFTQAIGSSLTLFVVLMWVIQRRTKAKPVLRMQTAPAVKKRQLMGMALIAFNISLWSLQLEPYYRYKESFIREAARYGDFRPNRRCNHPWLFPRADGSPPAASADSVFVGDNLILVEFRPGLESDAERILQGASSYFALVPCIVDPAKPNEMALPLDPQKEWEELRRTTAERQQHIEHLQKHYGYRDPYQMPPLPVTSDVPDQKAQTR